MKVELYAHQKKAMGDLGHGKVLRGDPGTGKSFTALAYFFEKECGGTLNDWGSIKTPKDLVIITTAKKRDSGDWQRDCFRMGLMENPEISVAGIKVTVDSWNNIEKYIGLKDVFLIFDEQKVGGTGLWSKSFLKLAKNNGWIILSATPGDRWLDFAPIFVANGFYKNITEFKRIHVEYDPWVKFPKIKKYHKVGRLVRHRNDILVEMRYQRHTTRNLEFVLVDHDENQLEKVTKRRWHVYEKRPLRDIAELFSVARKVVNSDSSRQEMIRTLLKKHPKIIVFYNFDYELDLLRTLFSSTQIPNINTNLTTESSSPTLKTSPSSAQNGDDAWEYLLSQEERKLNNSSLRNGFTSFSASSSTNGKKNGSTDGSASGQLERLRKSRPRAVFKDTSPGSHQLLMSGPTVLQFDRKTMRLRTGVFHPPTPALNYKPPKKTKSKSGGESTNSLGIDISEENLITSNGKNSVIIAEWNGHKHEPIPSSDSWVYLVQYRAGSEAWNCTETDAVVFHSMTYSYKDFEQSQGRIDRINTPFTDLWYYVLVSDSWIDKAIKKALDHKQNFNEARMRAKMEKRVADVA